MLPLQDFYFIRHGETDWNREHRGMGQQDIPLNPTGLNQAHQAAIVLQQEPIRLICSSPLQRARVTAQIISEKIKCPSLEIPELRECSWGNQEGQIKGQWLTDWLEGAAIPGAESYANFLERSLVGIQKALAHEGPVLIVAHGGVFWTLQKWAQLGKKVDLPNATPVLLRAPLHLGQPWGLCSVD